MLPGASATASAPERPEPLSALSCQGQREPARGEGNVLANFLRPVAGYVDVGVVDEAPPGTSGESITPLPSSGPPFTDMPLMVKARIMPISDVGRTRPPGFILDTCVGLRERSSAERCCSPPVLDSGSNPWRPEWGSRHSPALPLSRSPGLNRALQRFPPQPVRLPSPSNKSRSSAERPHTDEEP